MTLMGGRADPSLEEGDGEPVPEGILAHGDAHIFSFTPQLTAGPNPRATAATTATSSVCTCSPATKPSP